MNSRTQLFQLRHGQVVLGEQKPKLFHCTGDNLGVSLLPQSERCSRDNFCTG